LEKEGKKKDASTDENIQRNMQKGKENFSFLSSQRLYPIYLESFMEEENKLQLKTIDRDSSKPLQYFL